MAAKRFISLICCLAAATVISCAGRKLRGPDQTYVDEIKYGRKDDIVYLGIFTTRPVKNFYVDKLVDPPSIYLSLESVDASTVTLPRKMEKEVISSIETKTEMVGKGQYGQIWFHLNQDVGYKTKVTEYGLRIDLQTSGIPLTAKEIKGKKEIAAKEPDKKKEDKEAGQVKNNEELAMAEDLKELEEAKPSSEAKTEPEEKELPPVFETKAPDEEALKEIVQEEALEPISPASSEKNSAVILESIERETLEEKERITLKSSQAVDFEKMLLDREVIIELKGAGVSPTVVPMDVEESESVLTKIIPSSTQAPYPAAKVSFLLKEAPHGVSVPKITQQANEIYIDFFKRKKAYSLKEPPLVAGFEGYLASPTLLPGQEISIHVQETSLEDVLQLLSETSDYNFIVGEGISGKINLRLIKVPWDKVLVSILEAHQLGFVKQDNIIRIGTLTSLREEKEKAVAALNATRRLESLKVLFVPLHFRKASEMKQHLYPLLTERGSLSVDRAKNTIIIKDIQSVLDRAQELVASLDTTP